MSMDSEADWMLGVGIGVAVPFRAAALANTTDIIGRLVEAVGRSGISSHEQSQVDAWRAQIELLHDACEQVGDLVQNWTVVFEFDIPRRGKRVDAILLAGSWIVVLEFKIGAKTIDRSAIRQVEDYALELADFHEISHGRTIVPAVIATQSDRADVEMPTSDGEIALVSRLGAAALPDYLRSLAKSLEEQQGVALNARAWIESVYRPTPTIIEAAQRLYADHRVDAITRSDAEQINLTATQDAIHRAVLDAQRFNRKIACFITGVPGAGKTLAGLNAVHTIESEGEDHDSVFLSGNGPLVTVLSEALAIDRAGRVAGLTRKKARHESTKFVQNVHRFIRDYAMRDSNAPHERIVVFDEAQRAWDAKHSAAKFKRPTSEPVAMLEILDRHEGWAVFVGLVGGGQEINTGEAGLREWGRAFESSFSHWQVRVSPRLLQGDESTVGQTLFCAPPSSIDLVEDEALHLSVPVRSYRATAMGEWVNAVLDGRPEDAAAIKAKIPSYPIVMTRSLDDAREWLQEHTRGLRRCGLVCTSGARRLRRFGIDPKVDVDVAQWFLAEPSDVRSSNFLEIAATEFQIQGLELDWVGLCWDADLRLGSKDEHWKFRGSQWQRVKQEADRQYLINKYRVLLTRAREGLVIWIPHGSSTDPTRPAKVYDSIWAYLKRCGVPEVGAASHTPAAASPSGF